METRTSGRASDTRASALGRASAVVRESIVSVVDTVGEKIQQGTILGATLNTLCNVMGAGVLSLPFAMHNGSVALSMVLLFFCGLASAMSVYALACGCDATGKYSMNEVLANALFPPISLREFEDRRIRKLRDEGVVPGRENIGPDVQHEYHATEARRAVWRKVVTIIMEIVVILNNYGALIVYARVIADSIPPVIGNFLHGSGIWVSKITWLIISGVIFFALSCARHMEELKWASLVGFITIMYIVVIVVVRYATNLHDRFVPDVPAARQIRWTTLSVSCLRTMTTFGVAFGYQYNVPLFYQELENPTPKKMMITVLIAFPIITVCYGLVGLLGYMTFGALVADEHAGGDIVNNYPDNDVAVNVGRLGLFLHFVSVYPILSVCVRRGIHRLLCMTVPCWFLGVLPTAKNGSESVKGVMNESAGLLANATGATPTNGVRKSDAPSTDVVENGSMHEAQQSQDDVPRRAIIVEALGIVATSAVIAAVVPGIGVVIEVMGSLFGIFIMMIGPGLIGMCVFAENFKTQQSFAYFASNSFSNFSPHSRIYWWLSLALTVIGTVFMVAGIIALAYSFATA